MKKILFSLVLVGFTSLFAADSNSIKHFGFSGIFGYAGETIIHDYQSLSQTEKVLYGTAIGSIPGLTKELTDKKFDNEDMAFNVLGALTGSLLSNYLNNNVFITMEHNSTKKSNKLLVSMKF